MALSGVSGDGGEGAWCARTLTEQTSAWSVLGGGHGPAARLRARSAREAAQARGHGQAGRREHARLGRSTGGAAGAARRGEEGGAGPEQHASARRETRAERALS